MRSVTGAPNREATSTKLLLISVYENDVYYMILRSFSSIKFLTRSYSTSKRRFPKKNPKQVFEKKTNGNKQDCLFKYNWCITGENSDYSINIKQYINIGMYELTVYKNYEKQEP